MRCCLLPWQGRRANACILTVRRLRPVLIVRGALHASHRLELLRRNAKAFSFYRRKRSASILTDQGTRLVPIVQTSERASLVRSASADGQGSNIVRNPSQGIGGCSSSLRWKSEHCDLLLRCKNLQALQLHMMACIPRTSISLRYHLGGPPDAGTSLDCCNAQR